MCECVCVCVCVCVLGRSSTLVYLKRLFAVMFFGPEGCFRKMKAKTPQLLLLLSLLILLLLLLLALSFRPTHTHVCVAFNHSQTNAVAHRDPHINTHLDTDTK